MSDFNNFTAGDKQEFIDSHLEKVIKVLEEVKKDKWFDISEIIREVVKFLKTIRPIVQKQQWKRHQEYLKTTLKYIKCKKNNLPKYFFLRLAMTLPVTEKHRQRQIKLVDVNAFDNWIVRYRRDILDPDWSEDIESQKQFYKATTAMQDKLEDRECLVLV